MAWGGDPSGVLGDGRESLSIAVADQAKPINLKRGWQNEIPP
jgi:hypothetical protein